MILWSLCVYFTWLVIILSISHISSLFLFTLKKYKMHIDRNTGIIEMFMEKLQDEDEGTYTFQIQDGRATGHSTLVLIGDGESSVEHYLKAFATSFNVNTPPQESSHVGEAGIIS